MNKKLLIFLSSSLLICGCNNTTEVSDILSNQESSVMESSSINDTEIVEQSSEQESIIDSIEDGGFKGYALKDVIDYDYLEIGVNDSYNIRKSINNEFKDSWMDIYIENTDIALPDVEDNINGLVEGECEVNVVFDESYYDKFTLKITSQDYINMNFKFDYSRLHEKSFTVFGASNSDITVKPASYDQRQTLWCEQLVSRYDMTMYNYAKSGSTAGYCNSLIKNDPGAITIVGTYVINKKEIINSIENSDYVFFNFGGNDTTYSCEIGKIGEVNEENYLTKESFKGSYSYMIDKVRDINPNIKVVCMGMTPSTWKAPTYSRAFMDETIKEIANEKKCKYVYLLGLWEDNEFSKYCPDGTHPLTEGHTMILDRLISQ